MARAFDCHGNLSLHSMGTKDAQRKILSILHPNTILKPNPDPDAHPNPQPSPNPTPTPNPSPSPSSNLSPNHSHSSNPRLGSDLVVGSKIESYDVAKAAMNEIWGILFCLIHMAGMAEPAGCKG